MPRLSKTLPAYRLPKASGHAVVSLNGKDHDLGRHGTRESRADYERLLGQWLANHRCPPAPESRQDLMIDELIAAYLSHAQDYYVKHGSPTSMLAGIRSALRPLHQL